MLIVVIDTVLADRKRGWRRRWRSVVVFQRKQESNQPCCWWWRHNGKQWRSREDGCWYCDVFPEITTEEGGPAEKNRKATETVGWVRTTYIIHVLYSQRSWCLTLLRCINPGSHFWDKPYSKHKHKQGCGLRKIMRSPKVPNYEILGAQHLSLYEKSKCFQSLKGKS